MPHRNEKVFDEGWQAWLLGAERNQSPYPPGPDDEAWTDGWMAAEEDWEGVEAERDAYGDRVDSEYDRNR